MRLLDADVVIDMLRGVKTAADCFEALTEPPAVPGLVVMEIIQGCRNAAEVRAVERLIQPLPIIWPAQSDCQRALSEFTRLHLPHGLGLLDSLIGACAVGAGATLCTFNVKHYRSIPDLVTEQPYSR